MSGPDLSPALLELLHRRDELKRLIDRGICEYKTAAESEANLNTQHEREFAEAYLKAEGPVKERECRAKLETMTSYSALQVAIALRRSAKAAVDARQKDLDALSALAHAHNREIRVLGG